MNHRADQINALKRFKEAYYYLQFHWDRGGRNLNDLDAISRYPFHRSFDELDVVGWVNDMIYEMRSYERVNETGLSAADIHNLKKILHEKRDDIGCVSVHTVYDLFDKLKYLEYNKNIIEFHQMLVDAMPDLPNSTPEEQKAFDEAWEKFYSIPFTISFGGKSVTINNEATIYNGIVDTLKEMIDNCL